MTPPQGKFGVIYADPPWSFKVWDEDTGNGRAPRAHYDTMSFGDLAALPVSGAAADDCALFVWVCWPTLIDALELIRAWGFTYKTCAFAWVKANTSQIDMFRDDGDVQVGLGYWTRANSEVCLLATRGKPQRKSKSVRQAIIEPRREHSRKPDCVYERIERLVDGPYLELFARTRRPGWEQWGDQVGKFEVVA